MISEDQHKGGNFFTTFLIYWQLAPLSWFDVSQSDPVPALRYVDLLPSKTPFGI
jgi:hypothetical protein